MGHHSVAEAKNRLSELIDRALGGEEVVITRHGRAVIEFRAVRPEPTPMTEADFRWLSERRRGRGRPDVDAVTFVSQMRDEGWQ